MKLLPYRNIDGWLIPESKVCQLPVKGNELRKKASGGEIVVRYVFCPEWNTMMHVRTCAKCTLFGKFDAHGLRCKSRSTNEPPQWYNDIK